MPRRHHELFDQIISPENMARALDLTSRGKRQTCGYLDFKEGGPAALATLREEITAGTYRPAPYRTFWVYEPKPREIDALTFRDRVAQHALHNIVEPIFDRAFYGRSYACRKGRGTHAGAVAVQSELRRLRAGGGDVYFLKTDFRKYFHSIDLSRLWREIERKILCPRTLRLIEAFTPRTGVGLPIGNLTSQLWANLYGHAVDRWVVGQGALHWHRYMDDMVILRAGRNALDWLLALQARMSAWCSDTMGLAFSKWSVQRHARGINFLGYRIWDTHKLLRRDSVRRAKRTARALSGHPEAFARWAASWTGHAGWADTHNLLQKLNMQPI